MRGLIRATTIAVIVLCVAACSGGGSKTASPQASSAAPTIAATTPAAPTTTVDPKAGDLAAVKTMLRAMNLAFNTSFDDGLYSLTQHAYPAGAWTPEMLWCPLPGQTYDQEVAADRRNRRDYQRIVADDASFELDPAFAVSNAPGAGKPDGRVYVFKIDFTDSATASTTTQEMHAVIGPDGTARYFPVLY